MVIINQPHPIPPQDMLLVLAIIFFGYFVMAGLDKCYDYIFKKNGNNIKTHSRPSNKTSR